VTAAYITYGPDLAAPGSVEALTEPIGLARVAGVKRLVLLSGRGEEEAERAEEVVRASGLEWTVVRPRTSRTSLVTRRRAASGRWPRGSPQ
jgi:uncharacterized protein YbjT (DUF2867 family)